MKNNFSIFGILILIIAALGCIGDDTSKANKVVDEANEYIKKANASVEKAGEFGTRLDEMLRSVDNKADLEKAREIAGELAREYDSMNENFSKGGAKFEEASKMDVKEKHREYLETKAKEMKLRADYSAELKKIPTELIENDNKSQFREVMTSQLDKVRAMTKEAQELGDKADQIVKENPDVMQQGSSK